MRSLTCQHNIHSAASRCAREHEHAVLLSLNSAYTNECLHSQWNFHSNDGFAICAVHANIYGKMLFAPLRAALHNPLASGCNMLCTENDSNDKRERKKCAFLGNDDKSVVDVSNGSQSQSWVVWKKQRGECKTKQKIIIIEELAYQHIHTHTQHILIFRIQRRVTSSSCPLTAPLPARIPFCHWHMEMYYFKIFIR